jgi:Putative collagen-binding domain of a collagenase
VFRSLFLYAALPRIFFHVKNRTGFGSVATNTYAPAARTSDGSLMIAYMPTIRTITVDMSKLVGLTTARWYNPTNGKYVDVSGSPFANFGGRRFTPPVNNSAGDGDWVLVLEASTAR